MLENVLILSASAGAGHLRAAEALEKAFHAAGVARRVRHVDTLEFTNKPFRDLYSRGYLEMVNRTPEMLGWLYDYFDRPYANEKLRRAFHRLNTRPFVKLLEAEKPDAAVCTHFLPAEIIARLRAAGALTCPLSIVVTDFDVHAMWLTRGCDRYFVALEETRVHLASMGVPRENVSVTGIPIDPAFGEPADRAATRAALGLDADLPMILVSAGGFGVGPVEHLLGSLAKLERPAQAVIGCGRNEALKDRVSALARGGGDRGDVGRAESFDGRGHLSGHAGGGTRCGLVRFIPLGYTTEMHRYMAAADLLLGKPGGLTSSEAMARGLPMVIVNPIPGQEERNSDHLLEAGAALRCNNLPALAYKLDRLLGDPARMAAMRAAAAALGKPDAAARIVEAVVAAGPR